MTGPEACGWSRESFQWYQNKPHLSGGTLDMVNLRYLWRDMSPTYIVPLPAPTIRDTIAHTHHHMPRLAQQHDNSKE